MKLLEENFRMPTIQNPCFIIRHNDILFLFCFKLFLKLTTFPFGRHAGAPREGGPGHSQSKRSRPGGGGSGPASGRSPASGGGGPGAAPHLPQGRHEENQRATGAERQEIGGHGAVRNRPSAAAWP
jgi:hypothetical protein